ncbi:ww domain [Lecanosticta acicola]|uniref:Ww domain n=1 Tax=Lecanosticta acicola TaxID=111012 RepID=A0AAI9E959_9PEZI|nr:ww domain [Lecanosticta acicola]
MSFFKKLTDEFKDFKLGDKDKQQPQQSTERGYGDQGYGGAHDYQQNPQTSSSYGQNAPYQQQSYPPPQQYNQPPPQQYNQPPPQQYNQPPSQQYGQPYGQQPYSSGPPPQPPRWIQQFDQASQRTYYAETTGRSEWNPPANDGGQRSVGGAGGFYDQYGGAMPSQAPPQPGYEHQENAQQYYGEVQKQEKSHDTRNMLLAGAAGVAVGGLAGAALAGDDSDDEKHEAPAADPSYGSGGGPPAGDSDAESLREAQQDYNEAAAAAADSDASSDELEELQEAREEYEEEREEYYDD